MPIESEPRASGEVERGLMPRQTPPIESKET